MEKILNHVWGAAVTAVVYLISIVFFYQIIFDYKDLILAILSAIILSIVVRYIIAELLNNIEVDFNTIRELIVVLIGSIITFLL